MTLLSELELLVTSGSFAVKQRETVDTEFVRCYNNYYILLIVSLYLMRLKLVTATQFLQLG